MSVKNELKDDAKIAKAKMQLNKLGLNADEVLPKLMDKMGMDACSFVSEACARPADIATRTKESFKVSKKLILHYANDDVSQEIIAKAVKKSETDLANSVSQYKSQSKQEGNVSNVTNVVAETTSVSVRQDAFVRRVDARDETPANQDQAVVTQVPYDNSPEAVARRKAEEELLRMKGGKRGKMTFADLERAGCQLADMRSVVKGERISEISASPTMKKMAQEAMAYDRRTSGSGNCAAGINAVTCRPDTVDYNYQSGLNDVPMTYWRNRQGTEVKTKGTATAQVATMHNSDKFVCFDFDAKKSGNPDIGFVKAEGTILGASGEKGSRQAAGHITMLGTDGNWHTDCTERMSTMTGSHLADRYSCDGTCKYSLIYTKDAEVSDALALDILTKKYEREAFANQYIKSYSVVR